MLIEDVLGRIFFKLLFYMMLFKLNVLIGYIYLLVVELAWIV